VRIAAKRTRYATEFFASLSPGKRVRPYVQAMAAMQDQLGWLNDAAVAGRLLDKLREGDALQRESAALVRGFCSASGKTEVRRTWKKFRSVAPPWHPG
jgi:triphosphatase